MKNVLKIMIIPILLVGIVSLVLIDNVMNTEKSIDRILKSKYYSYLPIEAKDYIKDTYEKTGEVLLTEKNKQENIPYLNPEYVDYLTLDEAKQSSIEVIPKPFILDYVSSDSVSATNLPTYYNLSSLNYTTPIKDQGNLGVCWAFATIEQAESLLMVKSNQTYNSNTLKFSIRQMDYATSSNGILDYENENSYRLLTEGGNYFMSSTIMSYGLSMINDSSMPFNENRDKKPLHEIYNYNKSLYELNSSIMLPVINEDSSESDKLNYNNTVKENIMNYGGAYVGTGAPNGPCGFRNTNGTYAMVDADECSKNNGHALQIIGWNDNYNYSYCKSEGKHLAVNSSGNCDTGTLVTGTGAWILRNSWGDNLNYKTVYLGYDSYNLDINFTTSLSRMDSRNWKNAYHNNMWENGTAYVKTETAVFSKKIESAETIKKVKFISSSNNGSYTISIKSAGRTYLNIASVSVDNPGNVTVDLSNKNIIIDDSQFSVEVTSTNNTTLISNSISVFSNNNTSTPMIRTRNISGGEMVIDNNGNYLVTAYSDTKNISSGSTVNYSLYKDNVNENQYLLSVANNKVAANNLNTNLILSSAIPKGNYILRVTINNYSFDSTITIPNILDLTGEGTEEDPYLIYDVEDLKQINYHLDAYYQLQNDITLTENWIPIGTYNNPFRGGFDGNNHAIKGLTINSNTDDSVGLFGYVLAKYDYSIKENNTDLAYTFRGEKTFIKNIIFEDANVSNKGDASILIGKLTFDNNNPPEGAINVGPPSMEIDNVHFIGGSVVSREKDAGVLIGTTIIIAKKLSKPELTINNVFSSTRIIGRHSAGLLGYINDFYESGIGIMLNLEITNFQNVGIIDPYSLDISYSKTNCISPLLGGIYGNVLLSIDNYIINSKFNSPRYDKDFLERKKEINNYIGYYDSQTSTNLRFSKGEGYYLSNNTKNNYVTPVSSIKNSTIYNSWQNFSSYWKLETIDSITRIPILKNIDYEYTNLDSIDLKKYDEIYLSTLIPNNFYISYITYTEEENDNIVSINYDGETIDSYYSDIKITALNKGIAIIHLVNDYDGYEKDVNINVTSDKKDKPIITYFMNKQDNTTVTQQVNANESFNLNENTFSLRGFRFVSWNTQSDGKGTTYQDKDLFEDGIDEDLHLYAQWEVAPIPITGVTLNKTNIIMTVGNTTNLVATIEPSDTNQDTAITWSSSDSSVASVVNGKVTALKKGTATIIATTTNNLSASCTIIVTNGPLRVSYKTHVQSYGWQNYVSNGAMSGTSGEAKRLEAIKIKLENAPYTGNIEYRTHIQTYGWETSYKKNDEMSGTSGEAKRLEAIQIRLTGEMANYYDIYYRVHAQKFGWLGWAKNGEQSGTAGYAYRLEAIEIRIVEKNSSFLGYGVSEAFKEKQVLYTTHVQSYGWQPYTFDGNMSGTSGEAKRLEAIRIKLNNPKYSGDIEYRTHVQSYGWLNYVSNGAMSGTSGEAKRLEAIEIKLTGRMANYYDVYYRVHAQSFGWLGWAKNGEQSGTAGYAKRLEGIEIVLVNKGEQPPARSNQNNSNSYIEK